MAGDTSLIENYAFHGMYHIFDQHKGAGMSVLPTGLRVAFLFVYGPLLYFLVLLVDDGISKLHSRLCSDKAETLTCD